VPAGVGAKGWQNLVRKKLNIALLPSDKVFLRSLHVPTSDFAEIKSMVELQLEKLSPLPVTQMVWSFKVLPKSSTSPDALQPVVVIICSRSVVEEILGELEGQGYAPDRLEAPLLEQLLATEVREDGVWIYPGVTGEPALIAWWYGGVLHNLTVLPLPPGPERGPFLKTQLEQIAWAGELDGWMTAPPKIHLVADSSVAAFWENVLRDMSEQPVSVSQPLPVQDVAARSAQRCATQDAETNLLPEEYVNRYQQQFVDGLWMRGLFTLVGLYMLGVIIYFVALFVVKFNNDKVQAALRERGAAYTNALQDEAQIEILKNRQELKYAALDCWKAVAESMPTNVVLDDLSFNQDRLILNGTVPSDADSQTDVTKFNEKLRSAMGANNEVLFTNVSPPTLNIHAPQADWHFTCQMKGAGQ